jgi:hypothetical protein
MKHIHKHTLGTLSQVDAQMHAKNLQKQQDANGALLRVVRVGAWTTVEKCTA